MPQDITIKINGTEQNFSQINTVKVKKAGQTDLANYSEIGEISPNLCKISFISVPTGVTVSYTSYENGNNVVKVAESTTLNETVVCGTAITYSSYDGDALPDFKIRGSGNTSVVHKMPKLAPLAIVYKASDVAGSSNTIDIL